MFQRRILSSDRPHHHHHQDSGSHSHLRLIRKMIHYIPGQRRTVGTDWIRRISDRFPNQDLTAIAEFRI